MPEYDEETCDHFSSLDDCAKAPFCYISDGACYPNGPKCDYREDCRGDCSEHVLINKHLCEDLTGYSCHFCVNDSNPSINECYFYPLSNCSKAGCKLGKFTYDDQSTRDICEGEQKKKFDTRIIIPIVIITLSFVGVGVGVTLCCVCCFCSSCHCCKSKPSVDFSSVTIQHASASHSHPRKPHTHHIRRPVVHRDPIPLSATYLAHHPGAKTPDSGDGDSSRASSTGGAEAAAEARTQRDDHTDVEVLPEEAFSPPPMRPAVDAPDEEAGRYERDFASWKERHYIVTPADYLDFMLRNNVVRENAEKLLQPAPSATSREKADDDDEGDSDGDGDGDGAADESDAGTSAAAAMGELFPEYAEYFNNPTPPPSPPSPASPADEGGSYGGGYGGGSYSPPARSYSPPGRSYSPPAASYSPPGASYSPPGASYSPPSASYSPPGASYSPGGGGDGGDD